MRVLVVNPRPGRETLGPMERFSPAIPPLGPILVATRLQQDGYLVNLLDAHAQRLTHAQQLERILFEDPQVLLFSCLTFAMDGVEALVRELRKLKPEMKIVLGNLHATLFHEDLVRRRIADVVVRGEGEITASYLLGRWAAGKTPAGLKGVTWSDRDRVVVEPERPLLSDLRLLPRPDWTLLPEAQYEAFRIREFDQGPLPAPIQASRGCAFNCAFCSQNIIFPGLRMRPVEDVLDEMEEQHDRLGIRTFGFVDANFPPTRKYGREFAEKFRARRLNGRVNWFTEVRVDLVDRDLIQDLAASGCRLIQFGVESGDDEVLRSMGKGTSASTPQDVFRWCREVGILTVGLFVIGMPGETEEQALRTVDLALRLDPDLAKFSVATPYPGSQLWHDHRDMIGDAPWWKFSGWLDPRRGGPHLLDGVALPSARLARLQRMAMVRFYGRPSVMARMLRTGLLRPGTLWQGALSAAKGLLGGRG